MFKKSTREKPGEIQCPFVPRPATHLAVAHSALISPSANCTVRLFGCPLTLNSLSITESTSSPEPAIFPTTPPQISSKNKTHTRTGLSGLARPSAERVAPRSADAKLRCDSRTPCARSHVHRPALVMTGGGFVAPRRRALCPRHRSDRRHLVQIAKRAPVCKNTKVHIGSTLAYLGGRGVGVGLDII